MLNITVILTVGIVIIFIRKSAEPAVQVAASAGSGRPACSPGQARHERSSNKCIAQGFRVIGVM